MLEKDDPAMKPKFLQPGIHFLVSNRYLKSVKTGLINSLDMVDYVGEDFAFTINDFSPNTKLKEIKKFTENT